MGSSRLRAAAGNSRRSGARAALFWAFALVMGLGTALFIARYLEKRPGGAVVLVTLTPRRAGAETTSKVFLQNVKVLAVGQEVEANDQARMHASPATVATLLVSPQDAERLALASAEGRLLLTLRSWTDSVAVNTAGALAEEMVGEPVPPPTAAKPEPARP